MSASLEVPSAASLGGTLLSVASGKRGAFVSKPVGAGQRLLLIACATQDRTLSGAVTSASGSVLFSFDSLPCGTHVSQVRLTPGVQPAGVTVEITPSADGPYVVALT